MTQNQFDELVSYIASSDIATKELGKQLLKAEVKKYDKIINAESNYFKKGIKRFNDSDIYYILFALANTNLLPLTEVCIANSGNLHFFEIGHTILAVHNIDAKLE